MCLCQELGVPSHYNLDDCFSPFHGRVRSLPSLEVLVHLIYYGLPGSGVVRFVPNPRPEGSYCLAVLCDSYPVAQWDRVLLVDFSCCDYALSMVFGAYWDYFGLVYVELRTGYLAPGFQGFLGVVEAVFSVEVQACVICEEVYFNRFF